VVTQRLHVVVNIDGDGDGDDCTLVGAARHQKGSVRLCGSDKIRFLQDAPWERTAP
jgi:hypothetical protein